MKSDELVDQTKKLFKEAVFDIRNISYSSKLQEEIAFMKNQVALFQSIQRVLSRDCNIEEAESRYFVRFQPEPFPFFAPLINKLPLFEEKDVKPVVEENNDEKVRLEAYKLARFFALIELPHTLYTYCCLFLTVLIKRIEDLEEKPLDNQKKFSNLSWNGTNTELVELGKSLLENGSIKESHKKGKQKELFDVLSSAFNFEIKIRDKTLQDIKKRSNGSETLFLDSLKSSLFRWITKK